MAGFAPNMAQKIVVAATTAGGTTYGTAYFQPGRSVVQVDFTNGSTGKVYFMAQGSNSTSGVWVDLLTAPSSVTTGASVSAVSTKAYVFDRVRLESTAASATTASTSFTFWISAR